MHTRNGACRPQESGVGVSTRDRITREAWELCSPLAYATDCTYECPACHRSTGLRDGFSECCGVKLFPESEYRRREAKDAAAPRDEFGEPMVPCRLCGVPTAMTGTKLCDGCWELETRIRREPEIARRVLSAGGYLDQHVDEHESELATLRAERDGLRDQRDNAVREMDRCHDQFNELTQRAESAERLAASQDAALSEERDRLADGLRKALDIMEAGAAAAAELKERIVNAHRMASWDAARLASGLNYGAAAAREVLAAREGGEV